MKNVIELLGAIKNEDGNYEFCSNGQILEAFPEQLENLEDDLAASNQPWAAVSIWLDYTELG